MRYNFYVMLNQNTSYADLLTTRDVAKELALTPSRVRELLPQERLVGHRLYAGVWIIARSDLKKYPGQQRAD